MYDCLTRHDYSMFWQTFPHQTECRVSVCANAARRSCEGQLFSGHKRSFLPDFSLQPQINNIAVTKTPGKTKQVLTGFCPQAFRGPLQ